MYRRFEKYFEFIKEAGVLSVAEKVKSVANVEGALKYMEKGMLSAKDMEKAIKQADDILAKGDKTAKGYEAARIFKSRIRNAGDTTGLTEAHKRLKQTHTNLTTEKTTDKVFKDKVVKGRTIDVTSTEQKNAIKSYKNELASGNAENPVGVARSSFLPDKAIANKYLREKSVADVVKNNNANKTAPKATETPKETTFKEEAKAFGEETKTYAKDKWGRVKKYYKENPKKTIAMGVGGVGAVGAGGYMMSGNSNNQ